MGEVLVEVVLIFNLNLGSLISLISMLVISSCLGNCHRVRCSQICQLSELFAHQVLILHVLEIGKLLFSLFLLLQTKFLLECLTLLRVWRVRGGHERGTGGMWVLWHWLLSNVIATSITNYAFSLFFNDSERVWCLHERVRHGRRPCPFPLAIISWPLLELCVRNCPRISQVRLHVTNYDLRNLVSVRLQLLLGNFSLHRQCVRDRLKRDLSWPVYFDAEK